MFVFWLIFLSENEKDVPRHEYSEDKYYTGQPKLQISDGLLEHKV